MIRVSDIDRSYPILRQIDRNRDTSADKHIILDFATNRAVQKVLRQVSVDTGIPELTANVYYVVCLRRPRYIAGCEGVAIYTWLLASMRLAVSLFFILCLRNAWTYFNDTHHIYSPPCPYDINDVFKVMGSRSRSQKRFAAEGYWSTIRRRRPSSLFFKLRLKLII